jgi:hypothetical protein
VTDGDAAFARVVDDSSHADTISDSAAPGARPRRSVTANQLRAAVACLLLLLVIVGANAGLGKVSWAGPLRHRAALIVLALELIFALLLVALHLTRRGQEVTGYPLAEVRLILRRILITGLFVVPLIAASSLVTPISHFHINPLSGFPGVPKHIKVARLKVGSNAVSPVVLPVIIYGGLALLLLAFIVACLSLLRRRSKARQASFGTELFADDEDSLREAVEAGRVAIRSVDDARSAIIACYVAMETSLASAGAVRQVAETPAELLAKATTTGLLRGSAAGTLTGLFYEARFSSRPLPQSARPRAERALEEISAELDAHSRARDRAAETTGGQTTGDQTTGTPEPAQ